MTKAFTKTANDSTATVHVNEEFMIELEENPSTGYCWEIAASAEIKIISSDFLLHNTSAIGGGGLHRFVLKTELPGNFHLEVRLRRRWEDENLYIDRFEIDIHAK